MECKICGEDFDAEKQPGALLFEPPDILEFVNYKGNTKVMKNHICRKCFYDKIFGLLVVRCCDCKKWTLCEGGTAGDCSTGGTTTKNFSCGNGIRR